MDRRSGRRWALGVSCVFLVCLCIAHARPDAVFLPVNWSLVSPATVAAAQKTLVAPIGCSCVQTSGSGCPFFDCSCTCDLTAGACDAFCCCDIECTSDYVASVKRQGLCADTTLIKPSIEYCSTDLTLKSVASSGVNPLLVDSVLCVVVDNNEVVGNYIAAPVEQSMAAANAFQQNPKPFAFPAIDTIDTSSASTGTTYEPGDLIPVFTATTTRSIPGPQLMGWGAIAGSSRCTRRNPVRFGFDWPETTCVVDGLDLQGGSCEAPGGVLDVSAIGDNLLVATNPSIASAASGAKSAVAVRVKTLRALDPMTGELVSLDTPYPVYYPRPRLVVHVDNTTTCMGALLGVAYTVFHNGSGLVERVDAAITIGNLSAPLNSSISVTQSFRLDFVSTANITRSLDRGNLQSYERSGNPGYLLHRPIRVGIVEASTDDALKRTPVISEMVGGLALPGLGDCAAKSFSLPVLFGEDAQWSCALTLNASAFKSFCERDSPVVADALRVPFTRVARFGNADPFLLDEWLEIDYDAPTKSTATFVDAAGTGTVELSCRHVLSSLRLEFLVAAVGPTINSQNKLIAARATHAKDDVWTFWKNARDPAKEETFLLTTSVSFVAVQTVTLDQWIPPTPPLWFSIPNDVFYPFLLNDASRSAEAPSTWTALLWIGSAVLWTFGTE